MALKQSCYKSESQEAAALRSRGAAIQGLASLSDRVFCFHRSPVSYGVNADDISWHGLYVCYHTDDLC